METKHCASCNTTKPLSEYYRESGKRAGYPRSKCKHCWNIKTKIIKQRAMEAGTTPSRKVSKKALEDYFLREQRELEASITFEHQYDTLIKEMQLEYPNAPLKQMSTIVREELIKYYRGLPQY